MFLPGTLDHKGMLLNTASRMATVAGASRVVLNGPARAEGAFPGTLTAQSLAISPDGKTLYGCTYDGRTAKIAVYDAGTEKQTSLLRRWRTTGDTDPICGLTTDASGRFLLATVETSTPASKTALPAFATVLTGYDLQAGTATTLPAQVAGEVGWGAAAW